MVEYLLVDIISTCNLNCRFCPYHRPVATLAEKDPSSIMTKENFAGLLDVAGRMGIKTVAISGRGEPSLHPNFLEFVELVKKRGFTLEVFSNCLGSVDWKLVLKQVDKIYFTVAGVGRHYPSVHGQSRWETLSKNLSLWVHYREKVEVNFVLSRSTLRALKDTLDFFSRRGIYVHISLCRLVGEKDPEAFEKKDVDSLKSVLTVFASRPLFRRFSNLLDLAENLERLFYPPSDCPAKGYNLVISSDNKVSICSRQLWIGNYTVVNDWEELLELVKGGFKTWKDVPNAGCRFCNEADKAYAFVSGG